MQDYFKELDTAIYQGSFRVTDNDGGSATLALNIYSGNGTRLMIDSIKVSLPNTSAGRTIYVRVFDSDDDELQRFAFVGMDNNSIFLPSTGREANNANNITNKQFVTLVNADYLSIEGFTFDNAEYFDVIVRGYIRGRLPVVDTSGSSATPALTTNYSRIV